MKLLNVFSVVSLVFAESLAMTWKEADKLAGKWVKDLTNEEKINLVTGRENMQGTCVGSIDPLKRKNFKGICLQDGPAGVRKAEGTATSWQAAINTASTFDRELLYKVGKAQGKEFRDRGINIALTPGINIQRAPAAGRIWESFGEDPYLAGQCGIQVIKGVQDSGEIACAKHWVGNDQEINRGASSSNIPEQALWEVYIEPFYRAVKDAEVGSIMAAYNAVNQTYNVKNERLLTQILKGKMGFEGFVMSDWWAVHDVDSFPAGLDMNMPGGKAWGPNYVANENNTDFSDWDYHIQDGITEKKIKQERLDDAARRIIRTMYKVGQMEDFPDVNLKVETNTDENAALNRKVGADSTVLLKNEDNILPLKSGKKKVKRNAEKEKERKERKKEKKEKKKEKQKEKEEKKKEKQQKKKDKKCKPKNKDGKIDIAIIGKDAGPTRWVKMNMFEKYIYCQSDYGCANGTLPIGWGSGTTDFKYVIDPYFAISTRAKEEGLSVIASIEDDDVKKGAEAAAKADIAIVFVQADSGEQYITVEGNRGDRNDLDLWHNGNELIDAVADVNKNTIVVIHAPGPVNVPWKDKVKAIVFAGFPGQETGNALTDVLFGDVNPSAHLPYTWAPREDYGADCKYDENIAEQGGEKKTQYDYEEGLFVGYRWFDKKNIKPTFPFGFGLSYTTFEFSDLTAKMEKEGLHVTVKTTNTGDVEGAAVPMIFLSFPDSVKDYPIRLFKGFDKVMLAPGESKVSKIFIDKHDLSYYNVEKAKFKKPSSGEYTVYAGSNALDLPLKVTVNAKAK